MLLSIKMILMILVVMIMMVMMMVMTMMMVMMIFTDNLFTAICIICEGMWVHYVDIIIDDDMDLREGRFHSNLHHRCPFFEIIILPIIISSIIFSQYGLIILDDDIFMSQQIASSSPFFTDNLFTAICIICSLTIRPV